MESKYLLALVNINALGVRTFSYLIPEELKSHIKIGQAILVPFGRQGLVHAFVVGFSDYLPAHIKAKKVNKIINPTPLFSLEYLKLLEWVANYYCTDFITVVNMAVPMKLLEKTPKLENSVEFVTTEAASAKQLEKLEILKAIGKTNLATFLKLAKTTRATVNKLSDLGCLKIATEQIFRNPLEIFKTEKIEPLYELSIEQKKVYDDISSRIEKMTTPSPILLHGITASGKTEVYFKLIQDTINQGKNVLFLVPEIALASQLTKRLAKKFGTKDVAIWHSSISEGERYDVWQALYNNEIKILAGARSAVFAPLSNIGLIIIDEEHESAYKQTSPAPRYDAKVVAHKLAQFHDCPLLLGSATPDVSVYYRAKNSQNLFELKTRFNNAKVAQTFVINMQNHSRQSYRGIISLPLKNAIAETLETRKQVILLMNRRGFSTSTQCMSCGQIIECAKCAIPMIWHAQDNHLKCHYCGNTKTFPDSCPKCDGGILKNTGSGTQKIEILIKELFPDANVERIDSDILSKKNEHIRLLERFQDGQIDILVGTQMIAKGLDNPNVTLVGVISADSSFNLPDFRASERGFQLLTQVAGRAGRGDFLGNVIFQTYNPEFYALKSAENQDYDEFYLAEIIAREEFDYPPFSQVVRLILASENNFRAEKSAQEIALRLNTIIDKQGLAERLIVMGPSPCVIEKIKDNFRFQILIKNKLEEKGHNFISSFLNSMSMPKDIRLTIDVDPIDIL